MLILSKSFLADYNKANFRVPSQRVPRLARWIPPNVGLVKVNTDATLHTLYGKTGLGAVVRNNLGEVLLVRIDVLESALAPDVAEANAIFFGLSLACHVTDASSVISLLNRRCVRLSVIELIVDDIHDLMYRFDCLVNFSHVLRVANRVTYFLAKLALVEDQQLV
ncbi:hypothetical protein ACOSP7_026558 [Xanthoceras sorbifolium]